MSGRQSFHHKWIPDAARGVNFTIQFVSKLSVIGLHSLEQMVYTYSSRSTHFVIYSPTSLMYFRTFIN